MNPANFWLPLASVLAQPEVSTSHLPAAQHHSKIRIKFLPRPSEPLPAAFREVKG